MISNIVYNLLKKKKETNHNVFKLFLHYLLFAFTKYIDIFLLWIKYNDWTIFESMHFKIS